MRREYFIYEDQVGVNKIFRFKKQLYHHLRDQLNFVFHGNKTDLQVTSRVQTILRQRKSFVASGPKNASVPIIDSVYGGRLARPINNVVPTRIPSLGTGIRSTGVVRPSTSGDIQLSSVQMETPQSPIVIVVPSVNSVESIQTGNEVN